MGKYGIYGNYPLHEVREVKTIREMFDSSCEMFSENVAFLKRKSQKDPFVEVTYAEAKKDVYNLATALIKLGFKDKKIAVIGENRYEWAITYLAVVGGVGTIVPIDKELPADEITYLLDTVNADALIYSDKIKKKHPALFETLGLKTICMDEDDGENVPSLIKAGEILIDQGDTSYADAKVNEDDINILLFTSGTTGKAKAIMLSHKNICSNLMNMCKMIDIRPSDRFFSMLPIHHTYECTCGFLCPIYRGSSIAYCQGLKYIVKNLQEYSPTIVLTVPAVIEAIYNQIVRKIEKDGLTAKVNFAKVITKTLLKLKIDLRKKLFKQIHDNLGGKIRLFIAGAAAVDPEVAVKFREFGLHAIQGYGLTECSPIVCVNREFHYVDAAAGLPLENIEIKVENIGQDGLGEIVVKGENVMCGYYNRPEETAEVLKDGWFYTGDIGYMKDGFVYLTGRKKSVIITANGENVFPEELEGLLNKTDIVKECMVYEKTDEKTGKLILAVHILPDLEKATELLGENYEREALENLISETIKEINSKVAKYKQIYDFDIRETEFEKTTTQKIKRYAN